MYNKILLIAYNILIGYYHLNESGLPDLVAFLNINLQIGLDSPVACLLINEPAHLMPYNKQKLMPIQEHDIIYLRIKISLEVSILIK